MTTTSRSEKTLGSYKPNDNKDPRPSLERSLTFCISHEEVERLARRSDRQGAKLLGDCEQLVEIRNNIGHDLNLEIWRKEMDTLRRRELGYRRWHTQIYTPMTEKLLRMTTAQWFEEQHKLRKHGSDEFIRHCNASHGNVFLDIETPSLYCGHVHLPGAITRLQTAPARDRISLRDHTLSAARQRTDEEHKLMSCQTPSLRQASTDDIDEILRPGSKDFRVHDSREWQQLLDRDISARPRNKSAKQLISTFRIGNDDLPPMEHLRSETTLF